MNLNDDVVYRCLRLGFMPAVPAAWSVTVIAFIEIVSSVICFLGGNLAGTETPFDI